MVTEKWKFDEMMAAGLRGTIEDLRAIIDTIESNDYLDQQDFDRSLKGVVVKVNLLRRILQESRD
jgi:hypothetical protein